MTSMPRLCSPVAIKSYQQVTHEFSEELYVKPQRQYFLAQLPGISLLDCFCMTASQCMLWAGTRPGGGLGVGGGYWLYVVPATHMMPAACSTSKHLSPDLT